VIKILTDPRRTFNYIAFFVVFLNFTNVYTLISGYTAISFRQLSMIMMAILALNAAANFRGLSRIFSKKYVIYFFIFFILIPALGVFLSPFIVIRYFWYYVLSGLIFINSCLFIKIEGAYSFKKWILLSFGVTIFGILMSYYFPSIFSLIGEMQAKAKGEFGIWDTVKVGSSSHARAFGFYMQPNVAYTSILFQLIILVTSFFNRSIVSRVFIYGISFFSILLTGSRGGFIMFLVFMAVIIYSEVRNGIRLKNNTKAGFEKIVPYYACIFIAMLSIIIAISVFGKQSTKGMGLNVVDKIYHTFVPSASNEAGLEDQSIGQRLDYQKAYIEMLFSNPRTIITGHGTGSTAYYRYTGELPNASHNNFLEKTFIHGIFTSMGMYLMFFFICRTRISDNFKIRHGYNISLIITICILIQTFTINTLFSYRLLPVLVAFWLMELYFPNRKFQKSYRSIR